MRGIVLFFIAAAAFGQDTSNLVPLNDLAGAPYGYGYFGGLYADGTSTMPESHFLLGMDAASHIEPLDANGHPSPDGKVVLLAVGFAETQKIMNSMESMAANDVRVNHETLVMVNAALPGLDARFWEMPACPPLYSGIRNVDMPPLGVTPKQVQVAWVQLVNSDPIRNIVSADGDAYRLKGDYAYVIDELKMQYPNLRIAYLSSRVYGGYATTTWNPEPYAYETAYAVRWLIQRQIEEETVGMTWDSRVGDINDKDGVAPWAAWGPYLWANGTQPRSDGLTWQRDDFEPDGESLSQKGADKGGALLLDFLLHDPTTAWFRNPNAPPRPHAARH